MKRLQVYTLVAGLALGCLIGPARNASAAPPDAGRLAGGWFANAVAWLTTVFSGSTSTAKASEPYPSLPSSATEGSPETTGDEGGAIDPSG